MPKKSTKSKSRRVTLRQKYKVLRKVREHHRKARKDAKKKGVVKRKEPKDPGIPNAWPFKETLIQQLKQEKERAEARERKLREDAWARQVRRDAKVWKESGGRCVARASRWLHRLLHGTSAWVAPPWWLSRRAPFTSLAPRSPPPLPPLRQAAAAAEPVAEMQASAAERGEAFERAQEQAEVDDVSALVDNSRRAFYRDFTKVRFEGLVGGIRRHGMWRRARGMTHIGAGSVERTQPEGWGGTGDVADATTATGGLLRTRFLTAVRFLASCRWSRLRT